MPSTGYDLIDYGSMITDTLRVNAYYEALKRTVQADSVVIDIGSGTGIFALMACQLGARHVYAIEPNPWINEGRQIAAANGFADRITFIQNFSTDVTLPEQADIIVSEIRGAQPLHEQNLPTISDARKRFLKPGGILIPQRDVVYASLVSEPEYYQETILRPWQTNDYSLDWNSAAPLVQNTLQTAGRTSFREVLPAQRWVEIDYATYDNPNGRAVMQWKAEQADTAHYILIWFEAYLFDTIGYATAPWKDHPRIYRNSLFPLQEPLEIAAGDQVRLDLSATLMQGHYVYRWNTSVSDSEGKIRQGFQQSTFFVDSRLMKFKPAEKQAPKLNQSGEIAYLILHSLKLGDAPDVIAGKLVTKFADDYPTIEQALAHVTEMAALYRP